MSGVALNMIFFAGGTEPLLAQDIVEETTVLDTIVITSRKREEADVTLPVTTIVLTPEQVPQQSLDPAAEIARETPGTNFVDYGRFGESYLTMRGVATLGPALNSLDNTVGFSVDGVPTSLFGLNAPLLDVERIEVLEGPQGTTFGRNALAGSINVVSTPVDGERQIKLDAGIGPEGYGFVQGTLGGWIAPGVVAGRGVIRFENFDGDIPNVIIGGNDGGARIGAARGALRFTPDDTLTIDLTASYSHNENSDPSNILLEVPDFPLSGADIRPFNEQDIATGTATITKEFDFATFTSVTSFQNIRVNSDNDFSDSLLYGAYFGVPPSYFDNPASDNMRFRDSENIFNQEFRLNSQDDSPWDWVIGANYFRSDLSVHHDMETDYWPTLNGVIDNDVTSQTIAVFGDVSVPLGQKWEVSAGLRLAHDRQELKGDYVSNGFPGTIPQFSQEDSFSDTYLTGRMALSYFWTDTIMSYASVARGYSSGGFMSTTPYAPYGIATTAFQPATSWTYEVGAKAEVTPDVRLDASLFFNDVKDGQLSAFDVSTLSVYFASQDYQSYGFQANATATLMDGLDLTGGFSIIQSELVNVTTESAASGAVDGNKAPQVPAFAATVGLSYFFDAEQYGIPGAFSASANYQYVGTRYSDVSNSVELEAYHIVNLRLDWQKDNFDVYAFANNVLDERPVTYAAELTPGVSAAYVGRGRVMGVGMSVEW